APAHAQDQAVRPQPPGNRGGAANRPNDQITPADVQAMFETMALMEAERFVALTSDQFPTFVQRLKRLQDARGAQTRKHNRALNELRVMANPVNGRADDAAIEAKLKELAAIESDGRVEIAKAYEAVDQMLSVRQRARFRILEDNIEKKKIDF